MLLGPCVKPSIPCVLPERYGLTLNIFILDENHDRNARMHCDQHVVKMILEGAQILCAVLHGRGVDAPYRATHRNHPCVIWADESYDNYLWLIKLTRALHGEYRFRFGESRTHASMRVIDFADSYQFESNGLTPFVQCMPEQYRIDHDAVAAYCEYYRKEKLTFARWTKRVIPNCFQSSESIITKVAN